MPNKPGANPQSIKVLSRDGHKYIKFRKTEQGLRIFMFDGPLYGTLLLKGKDVGKLHKWLGQYIEVNHQAQVKAARKRRDD